jgi:CheY-like chemotaxis protein
LLASRSSSLPPKNGKLLAASWLEAQHCRGWVVTGEDTAKLLAAVPAILWALLAGYVVYLLRGTIPGMVGRLGSLEAFGLKLSMSTQAMNAAIEMAQKLVGAPVDVPQRDREQALKRANRERARLEGAEILWVDDRPSNNRNEARMLRGFGALVTFACSTDEAIEALRHAAEQSQPFHLILSDISRAPPEGERDAGLRMVPRLRAEKVFLPIIFYVARADPNACTPAGAFGLTNRPDQLLQLALDALARTRE